MITIYQTTPEGITAHQFPNANAINKWLKDIPRQLRRITSKTPADPPAQTINHATSQPTNQPPSQPTNQPTNKPTNPPTPRPIKSTPAEARKGDKPNPDQPQAQEKPVTKPPNKPTTQPTNHPTTQPTNQSTALLEYLIAKVEDLTEEVQMLRQEINRQPAPAAEAEEDSPRTRIIFAETLVKYTNDNGETRLKLKGGQYSKHGVPVYPENAAALEIDADDLEHGAHPYNRKIIVLLRENGKAHKAAALA